MTSDEVVSMCREAGVRLVRFLYCDNGGVVRVMFAVTALVVREGDPLFGVAGRS